MTDPHTAAEDMIHDALPPLYKPDTILKACIAVAELVRWLNHATFDEGNLPEPQHLDAIVSQLNTAARRLPQLFDQLANQAAAYGGDARLTRDEMITLPATEVAHAATVLIREASNRASALAFEVNKAHQMTARLYYRHEGNNGD